MLPPPSFVSALKVAASVHSDCGTTAQPPGSFLDSGDSKGLALWRGWGLPPPPPPPPPPVHSASRPTGEFLVGAHLCARPPSRGGRVGQRGQTSRSAPTEGLTSPLMPRSVLVSAPPGQGLRPTGESREGAALFGGDLGEPPNPCPLRFPPGEWADPDAETGFGRLRAPTNTRPEQLVFAQTRLVSRDVTHDVVHMQVQLERLAGELQGTHLAGVADVKLNLLLEE